MRSDHSLDDATLLALWERGVGEGAVVRDDLLLEALAPDASAPPRTLGERNARLLEAHARCFGASLHLLSRCPACDEAVEFDVDSASLAAELPAAAAEVEMAAHHRLDWQGHTIEFRLPGGADLAAEAEAVDEDAFAHALLRRCVLASTHEGRALAPQQLPAPVLEALSRSMERLDPAASVSFALACPRCAAQWDAPLDVGQTLWQKLQAAAERLLLDVDLLARCYGWSEREVLGLGATRRAAYLQLASV